MPFRVYILRSLRKGKLYVGMTAREVDSRLREHNSGSSKWTRHNGPFKLLHSEEFPTRAEAARRERFLKSGVGRKIRDEILGD